MDRRAISITKACESVGVSRRTIYNWMAAGKVEIRPHRGRCGADLRGHALACPAPDAVADQGGGGVARRGMTLAPAGAGDDSTPESSVLRLLFHRLNNQLGIILAHAELLEPKRSTTRVGRGRARWSRARSMR